MDPVASCKADLGQESIYYLASIGPDLAGAVMVHDVPGIQASSGPVSNSPENVSVFPFPHCIVSQADGHRSLGRRIGENITVDTCCYIVGSFLPGTQLSLQSTSPASKE